MQVIKANGSVEDFDEQKVISSIRRAGVPLTLQKHVLKKLKENMHNNITTGEIYHIILDTLGKSDQPLSKAKYSLKQAIMQLGPTGYPFEDFVARLLQEQGYTTSVRQILMGKCITHEIDVIAEKDGKRFMVEAKYHNTLGTRSEVHVPLYVRSRFEDLKVKHQLDEAWVVTNTKATSDAIGYALCSAMKIISWSFPNSPQGESLRDMVERTQLHPITMLTSLSVGDKARLLNEHIVLCRQIRLDPHVLDFLYLPKTDVEKVLAEVTYIHEQRNTRE